MPIHRPRSPARGARRSSIVGGHERVLLAAVDLSPASEAVFDAALDIAHAEPDATIHLLHVRRPADAIPEARAAETLADWAALLPDEGAAIELCAVEADDVPTAIVRAAARLDADVILVGTHGRTGVARVVRSSVAERVARTAGCSVFIVRKKRGG
ncbi:MAG: universal stress protein [Myxococcales bacterium]|nr:universal stress protein [Myxococcales bacterium]